MKRLLVLVFSLILLAGCAELPPGNYQLIPLDSDITPDYSYCQGEDCWNFVYSGAPTPTPEGPNQCYVTFLTPQDFYTVPNGVRLGVVEGEHKAYSFYYTSQNVEWIEIFSGWVRVNSSVQYDPTGPCIELPSEHENPIPTPQPTAPAPTPTPLPQTGCTLRADNNINLRTLPGVTAPKIVDPIYGSVLSVNSEMIADSYHVNDGYKWYKIWWFTRFVWAADFFTELNTAACGVLPYENPF